MTDVLTNIPQSFWGYVNIALSCVVIYAKHALIFISMFAQARVRARMDFTEPCRVLRPPD